MGLSVIVHLLKSSGGEERPFGSGSGKGRVMITRAADQGRCSRVVSSNREQAPGVVQNRLFH
jgi:hypothetical protein